MGKLHRFTSTAICAVIIAIPIERVAASEAIPQACASSDLAAWTLIERHGEAQILPPQEIADAFFRVMDARRACKDGRTEDSLTIYARVIARLNGTNP